MNVYTLPLMLTWVGPGNTVKCEACGQWVTGKGKRGTKHKCPNAHTPIDKHRQASVPPTEEA